MEEDHGVLLSFVVEQHGSVLHSINIKDSIPVSPKINPHSVLTLRMLILGFAHRHKAKSYHLSVWREHTQASPPLISFSSSFPSNPAPQWQHWKNKHQGKRAIKWHYGSPEPLRSIPSQAGQDVSINGFLGSRVKDFVLAILGKQLSKSALQWAPYSPQAWSCCLQSG